MPNSVKYNTESEANALRVGNMHIGTGDVPKGPTSTTGFYGGINPPNGGYTIYENKAASGSSMTCPTSDAELISITNQIAGASYTTINECFTYFDGQSDKFVMHNPINPIVTDGLVLILDANLIPSYPQSGTDWNDLSGQSANAEGVNMPTWNSNGWFTFDGTDDELHSVDMEQEYRDLFFVGRTNKSSGLHMLFGQYNDQDDSLRFEGPYLRTAGNIDPNDWQYGAIGDVFINGEFDALAGGNYDLSNRMNFVRSYRSNNSGFGTSFRYEISTSFYDRRFTGDLAYILCYNRKLTNSEVLQNYYQSPIVTDGLVLALDAGNLVSYESGSTTAYSLTGSFSGSLTDGTGYSSDNGGVFTFDGNDDRINNFSEDIEPAAITIEYWKKWTTVSDDWLIGNQTSNPIDNNNGFYHRIDSPSYNFIARFGVGSTQRSVTYNPIVLNEWTHVVTTFDPVEGVKLYWNSELVSTNTNGGTLSYSNVLGLEIGGANDGSRDTPGPVGPVRIYDRALTAGEVTQNYNANINRFN